MTDKDVEIDAHWASLKSIAKIRVFRQEQSTVRTNLKSNCRLRGSPESVVRLIPITGALIAMTEVLRSSLHLCIRVVWSSLIKDGDSAIVVKCYVPWA